LSTAYISGNAALAATLREWGIEQTYGVTGGGI